MMKSSSGAKNVIGQPPRRVCGEINYSAPMDERPIYYNDCHHDSIMKFDTRTVSIEDASGRTIPPRLDVEGFECVRCPTAIRDLDTADEAHMQPYAEEVRSLIQSMFKPDAVFMNSRQVTRRRARGAMKEAMENSFPANFVHSDVSRAGGQISTAFIPNDRPTARIATFNTWRMLSPGPTDWPLALLDTRSIAPEDLVPGDTTMKNASISTEMLLLRYNSAHRWSYFSKLGYDDLLLFKQWDSDESQVWLVPHTAFEDPSAPVDAVPRISREARAVAVWYA